jgi:hypothetical protein
MKSLCVANLLSGTQTLWRNFVANLPQKTAVTRDLEWPCTLPGTLDEPAEIKEERENL